MRRSPEYQYRRSSPMYRSYCHVFVLKHDLYFIYTEMGVDLEVGKDIKENSGIINKILH